VLPDAENADVGRVHDADGELGNSGGVVGEVPRCVLVMTPEVRGWRNAVLLAAGDKAGKWETWYRQAIPLAEQRYEDYLKQQEDIR